LIYATAGKFLVLGIVFPAVLSLFGCTAKEPAEPEKKAAPAVIIKPKQPVLSPEQRAELGFPENLIANVELSTGAGAEPFFTTVVVPAENLKGEKGFEREKLAGFSVRTSRADELIQSYRAGLRVKGYIIFKSHRGYGSLPDIVTVVKGNNSYDILKIQRTEALNYNLDTKAIIAWLKEQQKTGTFFIAGAGPDWIEGRFIRQPVDMRTFAKRIYAFAPDVREYGPQTVEGLAARMKKDNGFYLVWD
jgi:hypothetical protein